MKIAFNPSNSSKNILDLIKNNKDIIFDLKGHSIYARGVEFKGTDTNTWRPVADNLTSNSATSSLSANQGRVLKSLIDGKSDSGHNHDDRYLKLIGGTLTGNLVGTSAMFSGRFYGSGDDEGIIIKPSSNGYAGLILGAHDGERSIFYFVKNKPFWRYSHGSDNLDIIHPKKSGTIALTSDIPSSLKNPYALTISLNGTSQGPYDGSAAKSINITPGSIGAATSGHNHDGRYVYNYSGNTMDGSSRNKNALGMSTTSGISGDWWHILQAAWNDEYRWNSQIAFPTQNRNGMYYRSGLDDNTKWGAWVKLLDSNNYNTFHHLLTNGNTTVSTSTWTNPFSAYNKNAIADGQAICVWGQNSRKYSDNEKFSTDTGDMSLWLKRVNAKAATLNMVLDGEYYANGNQRLAHVSEIPNKNSWNYDDRYLKLTGGTLKGQIILPDIDVNTSYTGSIIIGASNTENLGIDGNEIMARNNGKASTLYLHSEGGAVQLGAILRTNSNIAYIGSQSTKDMIKFINNTNDPYGNGIAIGGGGLTIIGSGESSDVVMSQHSSGGDENMIIAGDGNIDFYSNLQDGWKYGKHMCLDTNGFLFTPSYINIGGNENNNSSPDRVWGSNSSDSYLRSYRTSALRVAYAVNADTVDGVHANQLCRIYTFNVHNEIIKVGTLTSGQYGHVCKLRFNSGIGYDALNQDKAMTVVIRASNGNPNGNGFYFEAHSESYRGGAFTTFYLHQTSKTQCELYMAAFNYSGQSTYEVSFSAGDSWTNETSHQNALPTSSIFTLHNYQIAYSDYNIASATKLATARKIWGQSFDGTADVDNTLRIRKTTGSYCEGIRIQTGDGAWATIILGATADSGTNTNAWSIHRKSDNNFAISRNSSDGANGLVMTPTGMGLGTTSPTQRLDVAGNIRTTGDIYITHATNNNMNYNTSNPRIVFSESGTQAVGLVYTDYDNYRPSKGLKVMDTDNVDTGNVWFEVQGYNYSSGYVKNGSNDNYILLGGGGHKALSDFAYGNNYVKAFGTSNANIDSDWGQSFKTFDPIPSGTPPEQNPNISLLSIGENFSRRKQLAFIWNNDNIYYRRHIGGEGFSNWVKLLHSGNSYVTSGKGVINGTTITQVDNAEKLGGMPKNYGQSPFGTIPCVGGNGVMEIGRYIDYHYDNSGKYDFSTRLQTTGNYANVVNLPSASGTLALTSQVLTWKSQIIDMRNYSESYWHPVTVPLPNAGYNKIKVSVQLNSGDKPSWATHDSGITCNMEIWATSSGWGTTDSDTICLNYTYKFCSQNPCGWMQLTSPSLGVVFLRGGSRYTVYTDFDAVFTPHNQKYTWSSGSSSQDTGGPYTSCPGLNFNIGTIRTDLIATLVQARRVCAGHDPGIDNSISCSNWFRSSGNTGWYNTTYQGGWYMSDTSWIRAHNSVGIYTGGQIYSSSSIRAGNICLEHTNEINSTSGIYLNYQNSGNISLCQGGGNVYIGAFMGSSHKLDVRGTVRSTGFYHDSHSNDDAVLLAGGGYKILNKLIFVDSYNYNATNKYNLTFHKLSGICNNLVWVDGHVYKSTSTSFTISRNVFPYKYDNDPDLKTICTIGADYISVDAVGVVKIVCNNSHRVGFFYTGIA